MFNCFDFYQEAVIDDQIRPKSAIHRNTFVIHCNSHLSSKPHVTHLQLLTQACLVSGFKKAGTKSSMHIDCTPDDNSRHQVRSLPNNGLRYAPEITQFPAVMAVAMASAERVFHLLDTPSAEAPVEGEGTAVFTRDLVFDRVTFAYGEDEPVLEDVSFTVPRGAVVAIVGPSGAGKTTLVDLVPRFHDPGQGELRMDAIPTTRLTRASLRALMGVVSQDTILLNDTVRANIAYGRPGADDAAVEAAARAANAHEFIVALSAGYATMLGERGTRLSGGQRQRIAIARALLRDPPLLILDEATSALDAESERLVQEAIDRLMEDRTVLVIAHRLATVRHADLIVVLADGKVVETGSHKELFQRGGLYRRLYDLQFREVKQGAGSREQGAG